MTNINLERTSKPNNTSPSKRKKQIEKYIYTKSSSSKKSNRKTQITNLNQRKHAF